MSKLDDSLTNINIDFNNLLEEHTKKLLSNISSDYGLDYEELLKKYFTNKESNVVGIKKKKKKVNELPDSSRCIANTAKYSRCTKSKLPGLQFCGFHKNKQQYGVIKSPKETLVMDEVEYVVEDKKLYIKEKLEHVYGNVLEIDFSKLSCTDCDGIVCEDGSITLY